MDCHANFQSARNDRNALDCFTAFAMTIKKRILATMPFFRHCEAL
ncbi:hypothetical protein [Helicobacter zhangjianzhongii]|uniref:Uncharacterized protein n=1 Tax=Helicobacter zhangjianzhongii TaxID=2974574 RepID=A0ACC6FRR1_9HELI|nr:MULTISPECIES: hypothetical protein [unclassified Helicobacter]MDL0079980.1 hypothetical protein [Helicobacter sp. CPD2-1]MDL0081767.1 hypothetical protein [Helicobacter sp. XJK30-2]